MKIEFKPDGPPNPRKIKDLPPGTAVEFDSIGKYVLLSDWPDDELLRASFTISDSGVFELVPVDKEHQEGGMFKVLGKMEIRSS